MNKQVKRPELLKESNREYDFFDFHKYTKNLYKSLSSSSTPTITTLVGGYGTGKSVLLNEVQKLSIKVKSNHKPKWVLFECWQYPDKRDLWEAFILDLVARIDGQKKLNEVTKSYSNLSGWREELAKFLGNTRSGLATIVGTILLYGLVFTYGRGTQAESMLIAFTTAAVLVLLASIEILVRPQSKSTISRLSDYKTELENTIKNHTGPLYIVLEDVDRAGELGRRFFETVSHFIKDELFSEKNIKVIVPIAGLDSDKSKSLHDSVDKASDNILYFTPKYNCEGFLSEVFSKEFLDEPTKQLLVSIINPLLGGTINIRKMKHILRNAIIKHQRLLNIDFQSQLAICIAVEFSKYMTVQYGSSSLYSSAHNNYEHKQLFTWATQKLMIDTKSDSEGKEIEPRNYFQAVDEIFADIRFRDRATNMSRGLPIFHREFLISNKYFEDL